MTISEWVVAAALLGAGMLLGELAGWIVRASMARPDRTRQTRELGSPRRELLVLVGNGGGIGTGQSPPPAPNGSRRSPTQLADSIPELLLAGLFVIGGYALSIGVSAAVGQSALRATGVRHRGLERLLRAVIMGATVVLALRPHGDRYQHPG